MRQAAGTGRGEIQFSRLRFGERDQFFQVIGGGVGRDHQHLGDGGGQRHRREILQRIVGDLFHARGDGGGARARGRGGGTVGGGLCGWVGGGEAAPAPPRVGQH